MAHIHNSRYVEDRSQSEAGPRLKVQDPIWKTTKAKKGWGCGSSGGCMPSKYMAMIQIPEQHTHKKNLFNEIRADNIPNLGKDTFKYIQS
jgi:hypothetical protein